MFYFCVHMSLIRTAFLIRIYIFRNAFIYILYINNHSMYMILFMHTHTYCIYYVGSKENPKYLKKDQVGRYPQ